MPYTKTKWCCNTCNSEYDSEKRSLSCEALGLPPETSHIKIGDTIGFTRNVAGATGEIQTFASGEGKVLFQVKRKRLKILILLKK